MCRPIGTGGNSETSVHPRSTSDGLGTGRSPGGTDETQGGPARHTRRLGDKGRPITKVVLGPRVGCRVPRHRLSSGKGYPTPPAGASCRRTQVRKHCRKFRKSGSEILLPPCHRGQVGAPNPTPPATDDGSVLAGPITLHLRLPRGARTRMAGLGRRPGSRKDAQIFP